MARLSGPSGTAGGAAATVDAPGSTLFRRVPPGNGYTVRVDGARTRPVTRHQPGDRPPILTSTARSDSTTASATSGRATAHCCPST